MANRQKSFFDQNPKQKDKPPPPWYKSQKPKHATRPSDQYIKPDMSLPAFAASSQSKAKLQAFQFEQKVKDPIGNRPILDVIESGKENNLPPYVEDKRTPSQSQQNVHPTSQTSIQRGCPQTPIGRLPLAELIANADDSNSQSLRLTPMERVLWNHSPHSSDHASLLAIPAVRRNHKRTQSSPSASSSQHEVLNHFPLNNPPFEPQMSPQSLRTPQADPAGDLWSRYSLNRNDKLGSTELSPMHLITSSSPQTPANHIFGKGSGGLKRSISCDMEWPTSAGKRRKFLRGSNLNEVYDGFEANAEGHLGQRSSKLSRVSILVEKIHDGLAKPLRNKALLGPSSSSPLPDTGDIFQDISASPLKRELSHSNMANQNLELDSSPSDFDDDEFDIEMLNAVDERMEASLRTEGAARIPDAGQAAGGDFERHLSITRDTPVERIIQQEKLTLDEKNKESSRIHNDDDTVIRKPPKHRAISNLDEFDESDSDLFAADLEDLVSLYDTQPLRQGSSVSEAHSIEGNAVNLQTPSSAKVLEGVAPQSPSKMQNKDVVELSSDDEFADDLDFGQIEMECTSTSQKQKPATFSYSNNDRKFSTIQRYLIMTVVEEQYETEKGYKQLEKVLLVQDEKSKLRKAITLRNSWFDSPCSPGSYIHLIGEFNKAGQCIIDDHHNMLILHPDHLLSATVVADSFSCTRRAVLQDRVKSTGEACEPTIYGSMLHEIFQETMRANRWDTEWLTATIDIIALRFLEQLFEINIEYVRAIEHLKTKVKELQAWAEIFVRVRPKSNAIVKDRNGAQALMSVNKLLDVEEHIWSPMYGLKGNIDATVQVLMKDGNDEKTLTVPLEVKTGRSQNASHKAQTSLYTLLLSDRYDVQIAYGILYYMETSEISRLPSIRHELIHMIMQRNELACYVRHRLELPPMLKNPHLCGRCYAKTPCFVYHKFIDDGTGTTSGVGEKFDEVVKHLKPVHQDFFRKWDDLLTKEEKDIAKFRRELWTMESSEREKVGRCFGNLIIEPASAQELENAPKINRFRYTFIKQKVASGFSFIESQITLGEPIVISDEKGHFALANGYVTHVQKQRITVAVDRRLHNARVKAKKFDAESNQVFSGIMEIVEDGTCQKTSVPTQPEAPVLYRLDKDEFSNGMATVRNNLIRVMEKDLFGASSLRKLVIEGVAPEFRPYSATYEAAESVSQANLNVDQKCAIEKVMSAKDYALVLGMPGTGKTTTIAHIIRALVAQGKSVLLTSYTHTAVDNILLKIRDDGIGVFRIGAIAKVHPEVQEFADLAGVQMKTVEEIKRSYSQPVVATTCLGINHPIFSQRVFDYCIVDEASQITLPVCLGPIRMAKTFILVGDHYQLPPLVQNKEAQEGGLDISLFKLLSDQHSSSVVYLEHQYRMNKEIMSLSNTLIYDGRLKCGTQAVASRSIEIPNMSALKQHHHTPQSIFSLSQKSVCLTPTRGSCWLRDLLDPSVKACFVNTDPLLPLSREAEGGGSRIVNPCEATLCMQLVEALLTTGVPSTDIGVITLYRSQLALIKQNLRHRIGVEMHTADKFQGRDKEVVILSCVRSNETGNVGELLKDWRRVNVSFTRARTKLLVLGSRKTLEGNELLEKFVGLMDGRGWRYDLPSRAMGMHLFEEGVMTQLTGMDGGGSGNVGAAVVAIEGGEKKKKKLEVGVEKGKGLRVPGTVGRVDARKLVGSRPVLRDIVNDAS